MPLPTQNSIELYLLYEIQEMGGVIDRGSSEQELLKRLRRHFTDITDNDMTRKIPSGTLKFQHDVDQARNNLVNKSGFLDGSVRGRWGPITPRGLEYLEQEWPPRKPVRYERFASRTSQDNKPTQPPSFKPEGEPGPQAAPAKEQVLGRAPEPPAPQPPSGPGVNLKDLVSHSRKQAKETLLNQLQSMSATGFEHFVGRLLEAIGFSDVQVTGRTGDGGIDGLCKQRTLEMDVPFQAKHWTTNPVRFPQVAEFRGGRAARYERGIYVTTSRFTDDAKALKDEPGGPRLILIDGEELVDLMIEKGLGVEEKPLTYWQVKDDFFSQFR